jgi:hypothetical protein
MARPLQEVRPTLPTVKDAQHLDCLTTDTIGNDIRGTINDELPGSCSPSNPSRFRKLCQPINRSNNQSDLSCRIFVAVGSEMGADRSQIAKGRFRLNYAHSGMGSSSRRSQDLTQATTSSCAASFPASVARMPSSMAARCQFCRSTNSFIACSITQARGRSRCCATELSRSSRSGSSSIFSDLALDISALSVVTAARPSILRGPCRRRRRFAPSARRNWRISARGG